MSHEVKDQPLMLVCSRRIRGAVKWFPEEAFTTGDFTELVQDKGKVPSIANRPFFPALKQRLSGFGVDACGAGRGRALNGCAAILLKPGALGTGRVDGAPW